MQTVPIHWYGLSFSRNVLYPIFPLTKPFPSQKTSTLYQEWTFKVDVKEYASTENMTFCFGRRTMESSDTSGK